MIAKLLRYLWHIRLFDQIPKLPRQYATKYNPAELTPDERRVMARLGTRDRAGIRIAMKRYNVNTIQELINVLEHQKPQRRMWHKARLVIGRFVGGYDYPPFKESRRRKRNPEIEQRIKEVRRWFK